MFCSECGTQVPTGSKFCMECGASISPRKVKPLEQDEYTTQVAEKYPEQRPRQAILTAGSIVIISLVLIAVAIGITAFTYFQDKSRSDEVTTTPQVEASPKPTYEPSPIAKSINTQRSETATTNNVATPTVTPTQLRQQSIINWGIAVPPGSYYYVEFTVPDTGGKVVGRFQATQGDNIQVHILDNDGFTNFKARGQYMTYYESGRVAVGNIDRSLNPGTYYLVFENLYSIISNKFVQASVHLDY